MIENIVGKKYNHWTILEVLGQKVRCQCDCEKHTIKILDKYSVTHGKSKSCGCTNSRKKMVPGEHYGYWEVLYDIDAQYAMCRCICGKEKKVQKGHLKNGSSISCGCKKGTIKNDLTGKTINYFTVLKELGGGKVIARCTCGTIKELYKDQLISGRVKSCGCMSSKLKSEAFLNDLTGQTINSWTIIKELGHNKVIARCSCGSVQEVEKGSILNGTSKSCGHDTNKHYDLTGQHFNKWEVLKEMGHGRVLCRCTCGSEHVIQKATLIRGTSKSCGCDQYNNFRETCLERYGEVTANRIGKPREDWQIHALESKESLSEFISNNMDGKPTILELCEILDVTPSSMGKTIIRLDAKDLIDFRPSRSVAEKELSEWVSKTLGLEVINNSRKILGRQEIDIYIPSKKIGIEFNGSYWHSTPVKGRMYHQNKTIDCLRHGVRLIHIFEYEWDSLMERKRVENYLVDILSDNKQVVYARNTGVVEISSQESSDFLETYHLQGSASASIHIGIFDQNKELLGVLTLGKPRFTHEYEYEIIRMCFKSGITVVGGAQKMFRFFLENYNPKSVLTYADISKFTGNIYLKMGFKVIKNKPLTEPNYVWTNPLTNKTLTRYQTMKQKLLDLGYSDFGNTEDEIMENLGYLKIHDAGSIRLEYIS